MYIQREDFTSNLPDLVAAAMDAAGDLQPGLPLDRRNGMPLEQAAARIDRAAGVRLFPDRVRMAARLRARDITEADIVEAIVRTNAPGLSVEDVVTALDHAPPAPRAIPTVADLAAEATGIDWTDMIADRIATWADVHFGGPQALRVETGEVDAWSAWRNWAASDLTPEICGLDGFVEFAQGTDRDPWRALDEACRALGIDPRSAPSIFERLLCDMWAWAEPLRAGSERGAGSPASPEMMAQLLAIRLTWEQALHRQFDTRLRDGWTAALARHRQPAVPNREHLIDTVLQAAAACASARTLDGHLRVIAPVAQEPATAQLVFTADARSERLRRTLEGLAPEIRTFGVGESFGLPANCRIVLDGAAQPGRSTLPAVLGDPDPGESWLHRSVGRLSQALVAGFALVQASGLLRIGTLVERTLGEQFTVIRLGRTPRLDIAPDTAEAADIAEAALRRMGLTRGTAPLVVFVARQARTWNTPDATGGRSTRNARALAQLLNEKPVRDALAARGFEIDPKCVFMAAAHDTIGETVNLFMSDPVGDRYPQSVRRLRRHLEQAARRVRAERALEMAGVRTSDDLIHRGGDWAETAPEAGASSFRWYVIGPRHLTAGSDLAGSAALHDYDAGSDPGGDMLADILATDVLPSALALRRAYMQHFAPGLFASGDAQGMAARSTDPLRIAAGAADPGCEAPVPTGRLVVRVAASRQRLDWALARVPDLLRLQRAGWVDIAPLDRNAAARPAALSKQSVRTG